ncbi:MAG: prenyltransferase/squalene oxidase repeat-containing protein [Chthoniobacteraceae bacterium]
MDPTDSQPEPFIKRLQQRLAASRFFTFSLLLHIGLVIIMSTVVLYKSITEPPDFTAQGGDLLGDEAAVQAPPEDKPDLTQTFTPETPQVNAPTIEAITTTSAVQTSFKLSSMPSPVKPVNAADMSKSVASAARSAMKGLGSGVPGAMSGRMGGTARASAMAKFGGKEKAEKAVMAGLRWLKKHQSEDGSWSPQYRPSMTGLAILCFLGHGELPDSPEFGPTVKRGLDWMLENGTKNEGRMNMGPITGGPATYEHGIATYAICEYYTMTKDERFAPLIQLAVGHIIQGQNPVGGWDYGYAKGPRNDLSVAGWQIQALKAAHLTGLNISGVDESLDKAMLFLKAFQGPKGGFGYTGPQDKYSLTGVGVLCTYFWKQDKDASVRKGIEFILDETEKNKPVKYKDANADLYAWYYHTQACLMFGGSAWTKWNRWFQDEICDNQGPEGAWPPVPGKAHGPQTAAEGAGPFYRTTLCVLMLEVFYRYMPINK